MMDYALDAQLLAELFDLTSGRSFDHKALSRVTRDLEGFDRLRRTWQVEGILIYKGMGAEIAKKPFLDEMANLQHTWYVYEDLFYRLYAGAEGTFYVTRVRSEVSPDEWDNPFQPE